jgi:hypothetical protein
VGALVGGPWAVVANSSAAEVGAGVAGACAGGRFGSAMEAAAVAYLEGGPVTAEGAGAWKCPTAA